MITQLAKINPIWSPWLNYDQLQVELCTIKPGSSPELVFLLNKALRFDYDQKFKIEDST
jgi:hypothetical protein